MIKEQIKSELKKVLKDLGIEGVEPQVELTTDLSKGDYSTNIAMAIFGNSKLKSPHFAKASRGEQISKPQLKTQNFEKPMDLAQKIAEFFNSQLSNFNFLEKVEAAPPGFINFWLSKDYLVDQIQEGSRNTRLHLPMQSIGGQEFGMTEEEQVFKGKKIMVEFAHPNTHKEMHVGHIRTLVTGEAVARICQAVGANVFRANYQGDVGPHVAKALAGVEQIIKDKGLNLDELKNWSNKDKAHFLGKAYVAGNKLYEEEEGKKKINEVNALLYRKLADEKVVLSEEEQKIWNLYQETRQWSLDYYDEFYNRFYTRFDKLFFESEVADCGKKIVLQNVGSPRFGEAGKVFEESDGAVIFPGEKYGLHNRVFVTKAGYPTYEGKDMCLGFRQYDAFPFDKNVHVVASEQAGYFKVVIKALEALDPEKFKDKEYHLPMGMVQLSDKKMSSRTGEVLTVDWLVDQVKERVLKLLAEGRIKTEEKEKIAEQITIGAIKYSVLKVNDLQDVMFDIEKSVSLEGNSGPYLQYTFARTQSVLSKSQISNLKSQISNQSQISNLKLEAEEVDLLRTLHRFGEAVSRAAEGFAPNILCNYLFTLAQKFNLFYQKHSILESEAKDFRLVLTGATGEVLKSGLDLLGIEAPERM